MIYDSTKDRSEEFGWKKVCDEHVPTEEEQTRWGYITMGFGLILAGIAILGA